MSMAPRPGARAGRRSWPAAVGVSAPPSDSDKISAERHGSGFHVVGGQFDTVWQEGAYLLHPGTTGGRKPSAEPSTGDDSEITRQAISYGSSRGSYRCRTMPLNQFLKEGETSAPDARQRPTFPHKALGRLHRQRRARNI